MVVAFMPHKSTLTRSRYLSPKSGRTESILPATSVVSGGEGGEVSIGHDDFRDFVAARAPALLRTATLLAGGNLSAGEDLLQDALAEVYRRWRRIKDPAAREAYTRRVLVRMATADQLNL
jgi:hypothetical protein